jgi:hypothetical protein
MYQTATRPRDGGEADSEASGRHSSPSSPHLAPVVEARGVLRDGLAAVRNLEDLLRSPRVGPRALAQIIPELQGFGTPLIDSVDQILWSVQEAARLPVDAAIAELGSYVQTVCGRLHDSLDRALRAPLDAKSRLSLESALGRAGGELNSVRQLLDLLTQATERSDTELDIEEVIEVAFSAPPPTSLRTNLVKVVAAYAHDGSEFRARPGVLLPLIAIGVAMAPGPSNDPVFVDAVCRRGEPVVIRLSRDCPVSGDEYVFEPPLIVPPSLISADTAARLASASFEVERDRVVLSWPNA